LATLYGKNQLMDVNYVKLRKFIERNKKFLNKVKRKLQNMDLGTFIIEESDSLITRKKKIRCLE
jgi:predicted ATP-grasp superfamily ATP-dependent carboligase